MKENIWSKILILLVMFFFMMPSLSPAQELSELYEIDDIELKAANDFSSQQLINAINSGEVVVGEKLDSVDYGPGIVEHMDDSIARDLLLRSNLDMDLKEDNRQHGIWVVPSRDASYYTHSGEHNVINKWGDTKMSIAFPFNVDIHGAWFSGQGGGEGVWASSIRVIGYRNGEHIQTTDWFENIDYTPTWFAMNLYNVDRIVIEAIPVFNGAGWYAMDDLTYTPNTINEKEQPTTMVLDFEDCSFNQNLNNSNYAGLIWETGTGSFYFNQYEISTIQTSSVTDKKKLPLSKRYSSNSREDNPVSTPILVSDYQGVIRGDAGSWSYPPDSCGAAGPNHFVEVVNRNFAVYDKSTGENLINILLGAFLPGSNGDPRVLYDQYSDRWFIIVCDFSTRLYLAVSTSDDPTGDWFKCSFVVSQGSDAGKWPDYPTLGVDEDGVYTAAYMIGGGNGMSIFALDKAPLIASEPSLGDIYAFRELPWEGAIQPVHTFDSSEGEYFVSRASSTEIRLRLLTGLPSPPVLTELCFITIPNHYSPPDAPALGSTVPLDTVGHRLMNAVYRDGYIWTAHCIDVGGRAASRWYKIDVLNTILEDYGTIQDSVMYYFFPTIMVNADGDAIMGFSGSHSNQYAAAYYTGRSASDPPGEMAPPVLLKEGEATYNLIDGYGRNRWGDYSLCSLDPVRQTLWTVQEYAHSHNESGTNRWGTWIGELAFNQPPEIPNKPDGPEVWAQFIDTTFTSTTTDPGEESIYYLFDWGDGNNSGWIGPYGSGQTGEAAHNWTELGEFEVKVKAKDEYDVESDWSEPATITIVENQPPEKPIITGPKSGKPSVLLTYKFVAEDPEGNDIFYMVSWGDGHYIPYTGPYASGEEVTFSHSWSKEGDYTINAKAKDEYGSKSLQSSFRLSITKTRAVYTTFLNFLQNHPNLFPILRQILLRLGLK
jgi:hypothetical protein